MKKLALLAGVMVLSLTALHADQPPDNSSGQTMDCAGMTDDMKAFAMALNSSNKTMFCSKFNDAMRTSAVMMSVQKDENGNMVMTPDQAVEKVATDNNMMMQRGVGGCPIK